MKKSTISQLKLGAHLLLSIPLLYLVYQIVTDNLGPDPAQEIVKQLGFNGACVLWLTLAVTPLRILTGWAGWMAFRRMLGLWSFAYVSCHLFAFLVFWAGLSISVIQEEIVDRPYILVGLLAWVLLIPLAVTSTQRSRRKLGKTWIKLHKLVYPISLLVLLHIVWIAKLDFLQPLLFALVLMGLFVVRIKYKKDSATR